ncbi:MAG: shikimate kinase [Candidatus Omnitrophica bacterium]|nr:shikimate kinase [Candidatus Omnitrophota bacterium]
MTNDKAQMTKNIVLVGFMGAGKSSVARQLAGILKRELVSTDDLIEAREGKKIADIFAQRGEPYFRLVESQVVREISGCPGRIIDCGGGVVLDPENVAALKGKGTLIYLKASAEFIYECVKGQTHRPLLRVADPLAAIRELLKKRQPFYEKADIILDTDRRSIEWITQEILKVIC